MVSEDDICALSASCMSFKRCSKPESFFGGVGSHGIESASEAVELWLAAGKELEEKSRLIDRSPDIGCFEDGAIAAVLTESST